MKLPKSESYNIIIITALFGIFSVISYAKWGRALIDSFRNAYVADLISSGNKLYSEIYFFYGPLIAHFNALLFKIFGVNLEILYLTGIIVSLLIVFGVYYLSRQVIGRLPSVILVCLMIVQVVFRPGLFQYIFPYSYEALYGCLILLYLIICSVNLIKNDFKNIKLFYISSLLTSLCILIKQDSAISAYLIWYTFSIIAFYKNKIDKNTFLKGILITILLPLVSLGIFSIFIPLKELINGLLPFDSFSPFFIENCSGTFININAVSFKTSIEVFAMSMIIFIPSIMIIYNLINAGVRSYNKSIKWSISGLIIILIILYICYTNGLLKIINLKWLEAVSLIWYEHGTYHWICIFCLIYFTYQLYRIIKLKQKLSTEVLIMLLLSISSVYLLFRSITNVDLQNNSNYYIFGGLIVLFYFIYKEIPNFFKSINKDYYKYSVSIIFVYLIIITFLFNASIYKAINIEISTNRGTFFTTMKTGIQLQQAIQIVYQTTKESDGILAAPEEMIINFMTGRKGATKYYQYLPGISDNKKRELILLEEIKKSEPKLIFISNNPNTQIYGKKQWGKDYNKLILKWIKENYSPIKKLRLYNKKTKELYSPYIIDVYAIKNAFWLIEEDKKEQ
ncbi:MAG: hypothetical protein AB7V50_06000 [Vampirovibrionia bacterium]